MTRLLLVASSVAVVLAAASGPGTSVAGGTRPAPRPAEAPCVCKADSDGGSRPTHGLLMVADRDPALPCVQGG
ncbi:MAG TPA: hypothetical protein VND93_09605 [Myxococcales bacterium]|nr:hypothetical protein [Myxococcales bacterium]